MGFTKKTEFSIGMDQPWIGTVAAAFLNEDKLIEEDVVIPITITLFGNYSAEPEILIKDLRDNEPKIKFHRLDSQLNIFKMTGESNAPGRSSVNLYNAPRLEWANYELGGD